MVWSLIKKAYETILDLFKFLLITMFFEDVFSTAAVIIKLYLM